MKRQYVYLNGTAFKVFNSYKKMLDFAKINSDDGIYYISTPSMTIKKTRSELLAR